MAQLGMRADGTPYTKRLTARTRRLKLYNQGLISMDLTVLAATPNLESLDMSRNPLRTLNLAPLAHCLRLEELDITAGVTIDLTPLSTCINLRSLHVDCRQWPTLDLAPLATLPHFENLHINGGAFTTLDLSPLSRCSTLQSLSLHCPTLRQADLSPLATCTSMETLGIEHTPLQTLDLPTWPNLQRLNLLGVPLTNLDLTPLCDSRLKRLWLVEHTLPEVDLTPLVNLGHLKDIYVKPKPRLLLDDVYTRQTSIPSPGVRDYVKAGQCVATGRFTRLKVLLRRLAQSPEQAPGDGMRMEDEADFWRLIEDAGHGVSDHNTSASSFVESDMASELMRRLWALNPEQIQRFHDLFWQVMRRPGKDVHHAVYEVRGGCSDDDFLDFREWLITQGQETFYRVVNDPQVLLEWGESGIAFEEGIVSAPLNQARKAKSSP